LAGTPFAIDRVQLAHRMHFYGVTPNSLYAVSDRDSVLDFMYVGQMVMGHLSRLSEDLIVYSSMEFGFVRLSDAYRQVTTYYILLFCLSNGYGKVAYLIFLLFVY
jgi:argininosuccinate lyase